MRNLFWILLLGNVILFAVMLRDGLGWGEPEIQVQPSLHEEMIRLMPAPQSAPTKTLPAPSAVSAPVSTPVPVISAPVVVTPTPIRASSPSPSLSNQQLSLNKTAAEPVEPACLEWSEFSGADLTRATTALSTLHLADKVSQRQIEHDLGYWVYIPPLKNKAAVKRKIAELKARHVRDYFVVQTSGLWLNAISLGVFKTRDAAQHYLHNMHAKGVRSARTGELATKLKASIFALNGVDAEIKLKLTALQKDFPGSELKNVSCALTR